MLFILYVTDNSKHAENRKRHVWENYMHMSPIYIIWGNGSGENGREGVNSQMCCIFYSKHSVRTQSNSYPFQFSLVTFFAEPWMPTLILKKQTWKFVYFTNHDADRSDINCVVCNLSNSFAQLNEASNFFWQLPTALPRTSPANCDAEAWFDNFWWTSQKFFFSTHTCSLALVECISGREPLLVILEIAVSSNSVLGTRYCWYFHTFGDEGNMWNWLGTHTSCGAEIGAHITSVLQDLKQAVQHEMQLP